MEILYSQEEQQNSDGIQYSNLKAIQRHMLKWRRVRKTKYLIDIEQYRNLNNTYKHLI